MKNEIPQEHQSVACRPWSGVVTAGTGLVGVDLAELEASPGSSEAAGSIEVKRGLGVTWLLVKAQEGVLVAAHRALEIYMGAQGAAQVRVLRRAPPEVYAVEGVEWELVVAFLPAIEEAPGRGNLGPAG